MSWRSFWYGKRLLITGHTGLKGAWAWAWFEHLGAEVTGFSYAPETTPNLAKILGITRRPTSYVGDIRDAEAVRRVVDIARPQFVLHMAAQALVRRGYREPLETFDVNLRGTLVVLDALRAAPDLKACVVVTSDKVYENNDLGRRFTEEDPLGGFDPYSASKAACEIATSSYSRSYFGGKLAGSSSAVVATARAGNVIGGGDWSEDRIVPDLWRARQKGEHVALRFPEATRPWQHVLDALSGYALYLRALSEGGSDRTLNFGPTSDAAVSVREVVETFNSVYGTGSVGWHPALGNHPKEAKLLAIDVTRATERLGWSPRLIPHDAIRWTARWYAAYDRGEDMLAFTCKQINDYEAMIRTSGSMEAAPHEI